MNSKEAEELLLKYKAGTATDEEKAWLETWYMRFKDKVSAVSDYQVAEDQAESWAMLEREYANRTKVRRLWPRIAVAAAAVAAITLGLWFYYASNLNGRHPEFISRSPNYANDIAPGKNTATLTLANGKAISLSDQKSGVVIGDKLAYNDGSVVRYSSGTRSSGSLKYEQMTTGPFGVHSLRGNELLTASTPRGGTYQVTLSDGTRVWLNADSKISFPSQFSGKQRKILLVGEAYFEVAKDKTHPFIVESEGQQVEVLGTHFNINSYADQGVTKTTLVEGSVRISSSRQSAATRDLKPSQQATLSNDQLDVKEADIRQTIAWKEGDFIFRQEPLESIMKQVARWYDVEVSYQTDVSKYRFDGMVSRSKNISSVLKMIELTGKVHFKVAGRRITVID